MNDSKAAEALTVTSILPVLKAAETQLSEAQTVVAKRHELVMFWRRELMKAHGIFPGAQVRLKGGRLGKITSVNVDFCWHVDPVRHKPWVSGVVEKKDGSWGTRETSFYGDWELTNSLTATNVQ